MSLKNIDTAIINWLKRWYVPLGRFAVFVVYFYFGFLKVLGLSPAGPLARALTDKTIGSAYFDQAFLLLAVFECVIGILFLFPKATRVVVPLLLIHVIIVCSPLLLLPNQVWAHPFVPTLEGQYIIKNLAIVALALGIAAQTKPFKSRT